MSRPDFMISEGLVVTPSTMPELVQLADRVDVGGVDEEFHGSPSSGRRPLSRF